MTLHQTQIYLIKGSIGGAIGITALILLFILYKVTLTIIDALNPPRTDPPNVLYGKIPAITFPANATTSPLTYTLDTLSGKPPDLVDRVNIYPIIHPEANFLNLDKTKSKMSALGITDSQGHLVPETSLGNANYEWDEPQGMNRQVIMNIVTFNFVMNSRFLTYPSVISALHLDNEDNAVKISKALLDSMELFPDDIDLSKTTNPSRDINYLTYPQLFAIQNGTLVQTTSLSSANIIRVDMYQSNLTYPLDTGKHTLSSPDSQKIKMDIPILYPHPPYSTINFLVGSGDNDTTVVQAHYTHQKIDRAAKDATYPIKTAQQAFEELKSGKGYVASFYGSSNNVHITNIFLAYYLGNTLQDYVMPVIVFEGDNGFFAYVSAIQDAWIK